MSPAEPKPSKLLLDECFAAADDRFLSEWIKFRSPEILGACLQQWLADTRPWARQQLVNYLAMDLNFPGHELFVKRAYRHFESVRDHEILAHFLVAFDRLVRRTRIAVPRWDRSTRELIQDEHLFARPNKTVIPETERTGTYGTGKHQRAFPLPDIRNKPKNRLFRHRTRNFLRRRVWRYFRWLSYKNPTEYLASISRALSVYTDAEFKQGENIIDNWSLMHACYFHSDLLTFTAAHTNLAPGQSLATLSAAPYRPEVWQTAEGATHLINLVRDAQSSLVRLWAMELLQRDHRQAISQIDMKILVSLLRHSDARVQEFASQLFRDHQGLASMTVSTWLEVLQQSDRSLLPVICEAMTKHVAGARLENSQLLLLATAEPVPVAALGLHMLQERHQQRRLSPTELVQLSRAQCAATAEEMTAWALRQLNSDENYSVDSVVEFFDGLLESMRGAAMTWLEDSSSHGHDDAVLWSRLIETPFDDVRLRLVDCLQRRTTLLNTDVNSLNHLWCSVLLGVHRGGRAKLKAMQQIQAAILRDSRQATKLLPVLSVAARSLRAPERRGAIAALASLKRGNPELEAAIRLHLPELQWGS
ncbi:MAG: hypothetical protein NT138_05135 [Planctomycetales bacterium]|nr:hypothetical protein [Planctomycetales bacterium]